MIVEHKKKLGVDSYDMSNNITINSQLSNIIYISLLQIRVSVES